MPEQVVVVVTPAVVAHCSRQRIGAAREDLLDGLALEFGTLDRVVQVVGVGLVVAAMVDLHVLRIVMGCESVTRIRKRFKFESDDLSPPRTEQSGRYVRTCTRV